MSDREKLIAIYNKLEDEGLACIAGKADMADLMIANGVTFTPAVPGHADKYNIAELAYKNGYEDGKPKWISVRERLPEPQQQIIAYDGGHIEPKVFSYTFWSKDFCSWKSITHWMPMPDEPKEV